MIVIVGLGNPGKKYENNRHNVGQMFVNFLINELTRSTGSGQASSRVNELKEKKLLHATCYMFHNLILVKPQTFMNLSGLAVKSLATSYHLPATNIYIVHDDLDIPLGKFRIDFAKGPKLHNGIASIEASEGKGFWRIRIGVDNRMATGPMDGESYVLKNFRPEEKIIVNQLFPKIFSRLENELLNFPS